MWIGIRCTIVAHFEYKGRDRRTGLPVTDEVSVRIEDDVFIGAGAIILEDVTIGHGAVVPRARWYTAPFPVDHRSGESGQADRALRRAAGAPHADQRVLSAAAADPLARP